MERGAGEPASDTVRVRPATPEDAEASRAILCDTFESTWMPQLTDAARDKYRAENRPAAYVAQRGLEFWLAERNGEVIGLIHWQDDFIHALHVLGAHARTGAGTRLISLAEAEIAKAGYPSARLETDTFNTASRAFYAGRGYQEAGRYPDDAWDSGLVTLLLVKRLD